MCFIHIGSILQEVVVEIERDAQQEFRINGVLAEGVVEAGAFHAELAGQPRHGAALPLQLILNAAAYLQAVDSQPQPFAPIKLHQAGIRNRTKILTDAERTRSAGIKPLRIPKLLFRLANFPFIHFVSVFSRLTFHSKQVVFQLIDYQHLIHIHTDPLKINLQTYLKPMIRLAKIVIIFIHVV